jgi:peptide deformylase
MKILSESEIPKEVIPAPEDSLIKLYRTCLMMENACLLANGVGLSAVQVGIPWKLFIAKPGDEPKFRYFVNVEYEPVVGAGKRESVEGCLSILSKAGNLRHFKVERANSVLITGKELVVNPELSLMTVDQELIGGFFSIVVQHEVDHQRGILISQIGEELEVW